MLLVTINLFCSHSLRLVLKSCFVRLTHQTRINSGLREYFDQEINEYKKHGHLPLSFQLNDTGHYETLARIRGKADRLAYLHSIVSMLGVQPVFAVQYDEGGAHTGFVCPYRVLRQSDLVDMSTWNYLKAQRLNDILFFDCSKISREPLAHFLLDMRAKFNRLTEPWWPILTGITPEMNKEFLELLQTKHQLHGAHLYAWETRENLPLKEPNLTLICADRGHSLYELDPSATYVVQIDADQRQCCLGYAPKDSNGFYKNIVKLEPRTRSFSLTKRILTPDLFTILATLKAKASFYKRQQQNNDDDFHIKSKPRSGLVPK